MPKGTCSVDGCGRPFKGRGWCAKHYALHFRTGTLEQANIKQHSIGEYSIEDCLNPAKSRGLCVSHYKRWWRNGSPEGLLFIGPIPKGCIIRHRNDTPIDTNPYNIEVGSHWDNTNDRRVRGRAPAGIEHPMHKLSDDQVREIRYKRNERGVLLRVLSEEYGISVAIVSNIARYKIWQQLTD